MALARAPSVRGPVAISTGSASSMATASSRRTVMLGWASTKAVTRALKASRSTARAPPAATRTASAAGSRLEPIRRISSFSRAGGRVQPLGLEAVGADQLGKAGALVGGGKMDGLLLVQGDLHPLPRQPEGGLAAGQARPDDLDVQCGILVSFQLAGAQPLGTGISKPQPSRAQYSLDPWRNRVAPHFSHLVGTGTSQVIKSQSG